jgi:hypothetical protein
MAAARRRFTGRRDAFRGPGDHRGNFLLVCGAIALHATKGIPMGKSFFNGTDAELYTGSESFSTKITATPTAYGLTAPQATAYAALNAAWRSAYEAALDPQTRTKAKVPAKNDSKIPLKIMASDLAKIIDGTATVTNEQKLDLGLSVRATPAPVPPPGTPGNFKVVLAGNGSLELKWKCSNPPGSQGTLYQIWRRVGAAGEFTYLGGAGEKKFTDATIPAGSASVTYQIQAARSTAVGPWAQFNVNFGVGSSGPTIASVSETEPSPKIAA